MEKRGFSSSSKHRGASTSKKEAAKKFSHREWSFFFCTRIDDYSFLEIITYVYSVFGVEAGDLTSTTTGLDLDSMLDRSDSDLSTNDARTIRKQLEGLENMYSEVRCIFIENFEILIFSIFFFSYSNNILYHVWCDMQKEQMLIRKKIFLHPKEKDFIFHL